jgi:hypothetical protein
MSVPGQLSALARHAAEAPARHQAEIEAERAAAARLLALAQQNYADAKTNVELARLALAGAEARHVASLRS